MKGQYLNVIDKLTTLYDFGVCSCANAEIKQVDKNYTFILKSLNTGVWVKFENLSKISAIKIFTYCYAIKLQCKVDNSLFFDFVTGDY